MNIISNISKYFRLIFTILFIWYFIICTINPTEWHFIDNVDLILHEAGHWIFMIFGYLIGALGGTINQLLVPLIFVIYFFFKNDFYSTSIISIWFGYNFVNVSLYIADAKVMQLALLGGDTSLHDWNYILGYLGLINQTDFIAMFVRIIGIGIIIAGGFFAIKFSLKFKIEPQSIDFA